MDMTYKHGKNMTQNKSHSLLNKHTFFIISKLYTNYIYTHDHEVDKNKN